MTVVNPKSISGINSITMASGSDDLLTIHSNNTTERVRVNNSGDVIIGSGVTLSPDGDVFATGVCTATSFSGDGSNLTGISAGTALSGSTDNTVCTVTGANAIQGESGLTFDGTTLTVAGASNATQAIFSGTGGSGARGLEIKTESGGATDEVVIIKARASGTTGALKLQTNGANCLTLAGNGGDVTVNGGNLVFGIGGKGIDFSATGDASGMTSELLDDYEEGTFAAVAASSSSVTFESNRDLCCYTKIGRQVTLSGQVQQVSSPSGTNVRIGIPFTAASLGDEAGNFTGNVALYDQDLVSGGEYAALLIDDGGDYARFMNIKDNNAWTNLEVDGSAYLRFTITYFTAS